MQLQFISDARKYAEAFSILIRIELYATTLW